MSEINEGDEKLPPRNTVTAKPVKSLDVTDRVVTWQQEEEDAKEGMWIIVKVVDSDGKEHTLFNGKFTGDHFDLRTLQFPLPVGTIPRNATFGIKRPGNEQCEFIDITASLVETPKATSLQKPGWTEPVIIRTPNGKAEWNAAQNAATYEVQVAGKTKLTDPYNDVYSAVTDKTSYDLLAPRYVVPKMYTDVRVNITPISKEGVRGATWGRTVTDEAWLKAKRPKPGEGHSTPPPKQEKDEKPPKKEMPENKLPASFEEKLRSSPRPPPAPKKEPEDEGEWLEGVLKKFKILYTIPEHITKAVLAFKLFIWVMTIFIGFTIIAIGFTLLSRTLNKTASTKMVATKTAAWPDKDPAQYITLTPDPAGGTVEEAYEIPKGSDVSFTFPDSSKWETIVEISGDTKEFYELVGTQRWVAAGQEQPDARKIGIWIYGVKTSSVKFTVKKLQ